MQSLIARLGEQFTKRAALEAEIGKNLLRIDSEIR
jgi:hypothetical protein